MTPSELKHFFKQNEEEIRSRLSEQSMKSKVSSYRARLLRKLQKQNEEEQEQEQQDEATPGREDENEENLATMEKTMDERDPDGKPEDEEALTDDEDITLESSQAPQEVLSQVASSIADSKTSPQMVEQALSYVPSEAISQMPSQAPTEQLAAEYKKLMEEYDTICAGNKKMEDQIEVIKKHWNPV